MTIRDLFPDAATEVVKVVTGADAPDLTATTPCADFDLHQLINHFVGTTAALARIGCGEPLDPDDPYGSKDDPANGDWRSRLAITVESVAKSWGRPEAWEGTVVMGGHLMPASMIGEMSLAEILLHGWDLARATGQQLVIGEEAGQELRTSIEKTAELGRSMGAYGPEVQVGGDADDFDCALAAAGRDPQWRPV